MVARTAPPPVRVVMHRDRFDVVTVIEGDLPPRVVPRPLTSGTIPTIPDPTPATAPTTAPDPDTDPDPQATRTDDRPGPWQRSTVGG
jgi:hypothetical protein